MTLFLIISNMLQAYGADVQENHPITNFTEMQSKLMIQLISPNFSRSEEHQNRLWSYLCDNGTRDNSPCTWRGVTCTDDVVTTFIFLSANHIRDEPHKFWVINSNWLPNTLQNVISVFTVYSFYKTVVSMGHGGSNAC